MTTILDPTNERKPVGRQRAQRGEHLSGRVGLLDISKPRGDVLLDRLEELLAQRLPDVAVQRYGNPPLRSRHQTNYDNRLLRHG